MHHKMIQNGWKLPRPAIFWQESDFHSFPNIPNLLGAKHLHKSDNASGHISSTKPPTIHKQTGVKIILDFPGLGISMDADALSDVQSALMHFLNTPVPGTQEFQHPWRQCRKNNTNKHQTTQMTNILGHLLRVSVGVVASLQERCTSVYRFCLESMQISPPVSPPVSPRILASFATCSNAPPPSEPTKASTIRLHGIVLKKSKLNHPRTYALAITAWSVITSWSSPGLEGQDVMNRILTFNSWRLFVQWFLVQ